MTRKILFVVLPLIPLAALAVPFLPSLTELGAWRAGRISELKNAAPSPSSLTEISAGEAERPGYCGAEAAANIDQAIRHLKTRLDTLKNDYEFYTHPYVRVKFNEDASRSDVRRRMEEKINDLKVNCAAQVECRNTTWISLGATNYRVQLCYEKARERGYSFCDLVQLIANQYGYMIDMPKGEGHEHEKDAAEMFGYFAGDLCRQDGIDRPLNAFSTPLNPRPNAPTGGIVLYPHANFEGRGRNFTGAFPDLRNIGRNNSFASLRALSGTWEACEDRDYGGWCHLFSGDWDNLGRINFEEEISSLRPVTLPRSGITLFKLDNYEGGGRNFTSAIADLKAVGITTVYSFQIHSGRWEVCRDAYFMNCQTFDSNINHLGAAGFSSLGKVSSLRPR